MKLLRKIGKLLLLFLLFVLLFIFGAITSYLLTAELVVKNELYTAEADRCLDTLMIMRSNQLEDNSKGVEERLIELLQYLKRPLFGNWEDGVKIDKLSNKRLRVFQRAKEYYEKAGWRSEYLDQRYHTNLKNYLDKIPWSERREELNAWNAKYKGAIPQAAPELGPIKWFGEATPLNSLRGKAVLLSFWGVRCERCLDKLPQLQKLHENYDSKGLHIIAVHTQNPKDDKAETYISSKGYSFSLCFGNKSLYKEYLVRFLPQNYLIDKEGRLIWGPSIKLPSEEYIEQVLNMSISKDQ